MEGLLNLVISHKSQKLKGIAHLYVFSLCIETIFAVNFTVKFAFMSHSFVDSCNYSFVFLQSLRKQRYGLYVDAVSFL